mgnify:CR=1 FL=1
MLLWCDDEKQKRLRGKTETSLVDLSLLLATKDKNIRNQDKFVCRLFSDYIPGTYLPTQFYLINEWGAIQKNISADRQQDLAISDLHNGLYFIMDVDHKNSFRFIKTQ